MAASPWTLISMAICLLVSVSHSSGNALRQDGAVFHSRVVRQLPGDVQERAEEAKRSFHEAASAGAERAQDLAEKARSHLAQRVRRSLSADYRYGPTGEKLGPRFQSRIWDSFRIGDGRPRRDVLEVAEEMSREGEERWRERREWGRERKERERERERHERQRERDETRREREDRDRF